MILLIATTVFHACLALLAAGIFFYTLAMLYSSFTNAIYVPSSTKAITRIFQNIHIKPNAHFVDLGCGDGKVVLFVAKHYGAQAQGVDVNPFLIFWAKARVFFEKLPQATFKLQSIMRADVKNCDYIYVFLLPAFLEKVKEKLAKELKEGCIVISHGFRIKGWDALLTETIHDKPFETYIYTHKKQRAG